MTFCYSLNCAEAVGTPAPADMASDDLSLEQAVGSLNAMCDQAKDALVKSTSTLGAVYGVVFPTGVVPSTADGFADLFGPGTSTLANFARANTVRGSESTLKLLMGHGVACDYEGALSEFPRKPDGKPVSLKGVSAAATRLAEVFMNTMERRAAETAARLQKKSTSQA